MAARILSEQRSRSSGKVGAAGGLELAIGRRIAVGVKANQGPSVSQEE